MSSFSFMDIEKHSNPHREYRPEEYLLPRYIRTVAFGFAALQFVTFVSVGAWASLIFTYVLLWQALFLPYRSK